MVPHWKSLPHQPASECFLRLEAVQKYKLSLSVKIWKMDGPFPPAKRAVIRLEQEVIAEELNRPRLKF